MVNLANFKVFDFSEGVPYVSVTNNGLTFNKSVIMKMQYPLFVRVLINDSQKQMAIQRCDEQDDKAIQFYKEKKNGVISVRLNSKDLINTIARICGWDLKKNSYRVNGVLFPEESLMLFDFSDSVVMD